MLQEVEGTWRQAGRIATWRASYRVDLDKQTLLVDGSADFDGEIRALHLWIFWPGAELASRAPQIVELRIVAALERMSVET